MSKCFTIGGGAAPLRSPASHSSRSFSSSLRICPSTRATGSKAHLEKLELVAAKRKLKLTEIGIQKLAAQKSSPTAARLIPVKTESEIYKHLGMQYVPPELLKHWGFAEDDAA